MRSLMLLSLLVISVLSASVADAARRVFTADDANKIPDAPKLTGRKAKRDGSDILEMATAAGKFTTLVRLVNEAGLYEKFSAVGPMTLFAPTDAAFQKLGQKQLDALTKDPEKLKSLLLYHLVAGKLMSDDLQKMKSGAKLHTAGSAESTLTSKGKKLKLDTASVTQADIDANNGVIHEIDTVLQPPAPAPVKTAKAGKKKKKK
jgi:uncharacterized surface protein with fasciclin (FAS1) repeats